MRSPRSSFHQFVVTWSGQPPLELAPERDRRVAHVGEGPARLDPHVDVHAAAARGLREARVAELVQQRPRLGGDPHGVGEVGARLRVEVDAQLVGMVDVGVAHRPGVERDRPHLRRPADDRHLGRADLVGVAAGGELDPRGLDVVGRALAARASGRRRRRRAARGSTARSPGARPSASARASSAGARARA